MASGDQAPMPTPWARTITCGCWPVKYRAGGRPAQVGPLTLSDQVVPIDGPGRSFTMNCCLEKDHLELVWEEAKTWPTGVKTGAL